MSSWNVENYVSFSWKFVCCFLYLSKLCSFLLIVHIYLQSSSYVLSSALIMVKWSSSHLIGQSILRPLTLVWVTIISRETVNDSAKRMGPGVVFSLSVVSLCTWNTEIHVAKWFSRTRRIIQWWSLARLHHSTQETSVLHRICDLVFYVIHYKSGMDGGVSFMSVVCIFTMSIVVLWAIWLSNPTLVYRVSSYGAKYIIVATYICNTSVWSVCLYVGKDFCWHSHRVWDWNLLTTVGTSIHVFRSCLVCWH